MIIQDYPELLDYVNAKLHPLAPECGSFLKLFLNSCLRADAQNFELIRPALMQIALKYHADPDRLNEERRDRDANT